MLFSVEKFKMLIVQSNNYLLSFSEKGAGCFRLRVRNEGTRTVNRDRARSRSGDMIVATRSRSSERSSSCGHVANEIWLSSEAHAARGTFSPMAF